MDEFAIVYESAARLGFLPRDCDAMEIWELASALGANHADEDADSLADESGFTFNQRRAIALERGEPPPSFDDEPISAAELAGMQKLMGGMSPAVPPGWESGP